MKIELVIDYMNNHFNQENPESYNIFIGSKPGVIRLDDETAVSPWPCGAVVCIGRGMYFIEEDDGYWSITKSENHRHTGVQVPVSLSWGEGFAKAIQDLCDYVKEHGEPYRFILGTNPDGTTIYGDICGYELKSKKMTNHDN